MNKDLEQLGGFDKLDFFLLDETANWPIVVNDATASQVTHVPSLISNYAILADSSIDVNVVPKQSVDGTIYSIDIVIVFSNRSEALENYLDQYQNKQVVVFGELNTGRKKLYGTNEEPLILNYKIDDGKKVEDLGVISVSIKGETRNRPVYYNV